MAYPPCLSLPRLGPVNDISSSKQASKKNIGFLRKHSYMALWPLSIYWTPVGGFTGVKPVSHSWAADKTYDISPNHRKSVIFVCEEVEMLVPPANDTLQIIECSSVVMWYRLSQVTTLEWDCRLPTMPEPSPRRWLPFKASLVHIRSIICSTLTKPCI